MTFRVDWEALHSAGFFDYDEGEKWVQMDLAPLPGARAEVASYMLQPGSSTDPTDDWEVLGATPTNSGLVCQVEFFGDDRLEEVVEAWCADLHRALPLVSGVLKPASTEYFELPLQPLRATWAVLLFRPSLPLAPHGAPPERGIPEIPRGDWRRLADWVAEAGTVYTHAFTPLEPWDGEDLQERWRGMPDAHWYFMVAWSAPRDRLRAVAMKDGAVALYAAETGRGDGSGQLLEDLGGWALDALSEDVLVEAYGLLVPPASDSEALRARRARDGLYELRLDGQRWWLLADLAVLRIGESAEPEHWGEGWVREDGASRRPVFRRSGHPAPM